jgi:hypothetical protein
MLQGENYRKNLAPRHRFVVVPEPDSVEKRTICAVAGMEAVGEVVCEVAECELVLSIALLAPDW